jgi:GABA permease
VSDSARPLRDPTSVYRVVRLVAAHADGWEEATRSGVAELAKTISELRLARVTERDAVVRDGEVIAYRVKLEASYRMDRRRLSSAGTTTVRRYLVVANETLGQSDLQAAIAQRIAAGPAEFHVLVPEAVSGWTLGGGLPDPVSGFIPVDPATLAATRQQSQDEARERLDGELARLHARGVMATGEVGPYDPVGAVAQVLERSSFDEIIVSTLPAPVSRWLRLDLARRLERRFHLPVTHVAHGGTPAPTG